MLDTPSEKTNRILEVANFVENLGDDLYDQSTYGKHGHDEPKCLCGWINEAFLETSYTSDYVSAARYLGITGREVTKLFDGAPYWRDDYTHPTAAEAASVLRHLALTGEVDWQRAHTRKEPALVE